MTVSYDYPRPMVTVDIILCRFEKTNIEILLIQRKHPPFQGKWALPGGYVGMREELKSYLLNLQGLEFIYEKSLFPELEYIFKHTLTQEVAYNSLLQKRRKEIHENIGEAIEQIYSQRLQEFYEILSAEFEVLAP